MTELVALDLIDAETVALSLEEGDQVALSFTEEVVKFEVLGEVGAQGPRGYAGTITVGDVTTGTAGTEAIIINVGTVHDAVLDFEIPRGDKGDKGDQGDVGTAATVDVGSTTTGPAGTQANVANSGTTLDAVLDFTIPRGDTGAAATIAVGDVDASTPGSQPSVTNVGSLTDAIFEFVLPRGDTGPQGPAGLDTGFYRHNQGSPAAVWNINHNLGFYPAVSVQDSAGSVVYGDVQYIDTNNVTVTFEAAMGGYANLS